MSDFLSRMLRTITMSFDWPMWMWPIIAAIAVWVVFSLVKREQLASSFVLLATGFSVAFLVGITAFVAAFWVAPAYPAPAPQLLHAAILGDIWWAYLLIMVLLVAFARGIRLPMAALALLMVWINLNIAFIGTMAVEGNWM